MFSLLKNLNIPERWDCLMVQLSKNKRKIADYLNELQEPYDFYIGKYILYNNKDNGKHRNHWEKNIFNYLNDIQEFLKKNLGKKPDKKFLKNWFFTLRIDSLFYFEKSLKRTENKCGLLEPPYPKRTRKVNIKKTYEAYVYFIDVCSSYMEKGDLTEEILKKEIRKLIV